MFTTHRKLILTFILLKISQIILLIMCIQKIDMQINILIKTIKFKEFWSPVRQQIWPWRRSEVTIKVTTWYHQKGLVTKNTHAKYQSSTCKSAKVIAKVKVFVTDGRMRFNVPALSRKRGTIILRVTFCMTQLIWFHFSKTMNLCRYPVLKWAKILHD